MTRIMTLIRTPYELDKMSLFQDLKLKRRKIDSRCSSDGESVADTSTSSPDHTSLPSPKMSDVGINPPSPDSTPKQIHHLESSSSIASTHIEICSVFDGGGVGVIRAAPTGRSQSPPIRSARLNNPSQPPRPHSSPGRPTSSSPSIGEIDSLMSTSSTCSSHSLHPSPALEPPSPSHNSVAIISTQQGTNIQNQLWLQNSRINGVKPEIIGGNFNSTAILGHSPESKSCAGKRLNSNVVLRQAPTVIMGEAGGVRTMVWSQPSVNVSQSLEQAQASTFNWNTSNNGSTVNIVNNNPEETAAQMLLNLGQERPRVSTSKTTTVLRPPATTLSGQFTTIPLNMEKLWAGDLSQLPTNQQLQALNLTSPNITSTPPIYLNPRTDVKVTGYTVEPGLDALEDDEQPMICMICEDKATGLHYGIITCEGCKGFFKRTVQNRRVYTCVADGNCEITKAQRNRCQYCRFKKCIEQGMVLQAVREDRMPGGRNSGAVYNLYKVKYKKHKKTTNKQMQQKTNEKALLSPQLKLEQPPIPPHLVNGTILKTALTNPSEVVHLRQRLDSTVSSSRDRNFSIEYTLSMIQTLIDCDEFQDIATLQNVDDLLDHKSDLSEKLCQIGDSIVYKLVQWTKRLPFYLELPVEVHTRLLTHKWHELLVLTTSAFQAIHAKSKASVEQLTSIPEPDFTEEVSNNLCTLQSCLTSMMGRSITMDQLQQDVGLMVEKITHVTLMFRRIKLSMEEYVCLKVITMLNQGKSGVNASGADLENIQERYMTCLRVYTQHIYPEQPSRFQELLIRLPEVQSAAALLLESKMFYVPFLLNSTVQR
ncbi:hormone receptor 4 isoform X2 [Photinus pyralis]|uniref:hormone receptor 4 isoform X2 n=1 Tax=Photinus pyralis TaxID=7054 RepID=UPI001267097A|nr:hormone receptor 4 isoform X2 [Photinus pyralis]